MMARRRRQRMRKTTSVWRKHFSLRWRLIPSPCVGPTGVGASAVERSAAAQKGTETFHMY